MADLTKKYTNYYIAKIINEYVNSIYAYKRQDFVAYLFWVIQRMHPGHDMERLNLYRSYGSFKDQHYSDVRNLLKILKDLMKKQLPGFVDYKAWRVREMFSNGK